MKKLMMVLCLLLFGCNIKPDVYVRPVRTLIASGTVQESVCVQYSCRVMAYVNSDSGDDVVFKDIGGLVIKGDSICHVRFECQGLENAVTFGLHFIESSSQEYWTLCSESYKDPFQCKVN